MTNNNSAPARSDRSAVPSNSDPIVRRDYDARRQRRDLAHPESGVHVCPSCRREWDAIFFRTTTCTCGTEGKPWEPSNRPWLRYVQVVPQAHPADILWSFRDARRRYEAEQRPSAGPSRLTSGSLRGRLRGLVAKVLDAPVGERNTVLHWAACRAGEMVAEGLLDEATAAAVLGDAGLASGLTSHEIGDASRGTVGSGLRTGMSGGAA